MKQITYINYLKIPKNNHGPHNMPVFEASEVGPSNGKGLKVRNNAL